MNNIYLDVVKLDRCLTCAVSVMFDLQHLGVPDACLNAHRHYYK